ncbi:MAG: phosphohydrolase [Alphaproteobacteria bacterium]|nr:phosphohydrolase [Alphaproteobacteria bacterium]
MPIKHRNAGEKSPLLRDDWAYASPVSLDDFSTQDWILLDSQRGPYGAAERTKQALEMLTAQASAPTFGYQINNYEHCLQAATLALQDGADDEDIVVALFHDLGFVTNNENHGEFAAAFLKSYISDRNVWMLERHMYFQAVHCATHPAVDPDVRERWRGHPHFEYAANWVARYDVPSINPDFENAPLDTFIPMVERLFATLRRDIPLPD